MSGSENYILEKEIWTEADFEVMNWHDCKIWAMMTHSDYDNYSWEIFFDIDYIFKWVASKDNKGWSDFWISPVTMVFLGTSDWKLDIEAPQCDIEILELSMENPRKTLNPQYTKYTFRFKCVEGEISFTAVGYKMYVRQKPMLGDTWSLTYNQRGGVSFDRGMK
ncbi:MAG: hypothetical protein ACQ9MH_14070 [Nitrospinales bacterium]